MKPTSGCVLHKRFSEKSCTFASEKNVVIMGIKRVISLSAHLFVSMVLLAHLFVCHHHDHDHDNQTLVAACATNQEHDCNHDTEQHKDCPDANDVHKCCVVDNCILNDLFAPTNIVKLPKKFFNSFDFFTSNISDNQTIQVADLSGLPFRQKPFIPLFYTEFISQSIGLRAPPIC
jgi:hypothetical protein